MTGKYSLLRGSVHGKRLSTIGAILVFMHSRRKEISEDLDELKPATDQRREPR
jgi:hypothetical protein